MVAFTKRGGSWRMQVARERHRCTWALLTGDPIVVYIYT